MANWLAGMRITAARLKVDSAEVEDTTLGRTTTSTSFTDLSTGGAFSTSLVVPFSGAVWVHLRSTQRNSGAANTITHFEATGSVSGSVYGASTAAAILVTGTNNISLSLRKRLSGLVPGEIVTVTSKHRVNTASTATVDYRYLSIQGAP